MNDAPLQAGLRFNDLTIPQGAASTAPVVRFLAMTQKRHGSNIRIEDAGDASAFTTKAIT